VSRARPLVARIVPWAVVPVPLLLVAIGALWFLGVDESLESRSLLTVLDFTLVTCTSAAIALLAGRTFVATGAPGILFLGAGVLLMGATFTAAPLAGMREPNITATVHNIGMLAAGVLCLIGSWMSNRPRAPVRTPGPAILAAYVGAVAFVAGTAYLALEGITPPFFVQGTGGTPLRQVVLASSVGLFGAAGLILVLAQGKATTFRRWYALGLVLLGVGLLGVLLQQAIGSPISWVGRIAQYLGSVYLLVASMTSAAEARRWVLPLEAELREERVQAQLFREAKEQLARVLAGSNDGFWDWNIQSGQLEFSDRWAEMFGYTRSELAPSLSTWQGMVHPDDREEARATQNRIARGEMDRYEVERRLRHKDGHWVWVHVRGKVAERDRDGKPTRMAGTYTDITGRKRAEEALSASEARLSAVVEGSGDGFVDIDARSGVIFRSPRLWEIAGWPKGSLPERPESFLGLVHPEDVGRVGARIAALLAGTVDHLDEEYRLRSSKGTWTWVQTRLRVVNWAEGGKPARVAGTVRDISRSKEVEESLREREAKLQAYFNTPAVGIAVSRPGKAWVEVNDAFCSMLGYSRDELQKLTWAELTHPEDVEADVREFNRVLAGESEGYSLDKRYIRKDGSVLWVLLAVSCVRFPDRSVELLVAVARDVTDRKMSEQAVAASQAKYRRLFESLMDGFVVMDMDGAIRESNEAYRKMLGYSAEELAQFTHRDLTPERWHPIQARIIAEQVLPRGFSDTYEKEYRRKDGTVFPVELRAFLMKEGGRPVAMWAIVRDVTEARALQVKLAVAGRMAAVGTLVAGVAHEINNPLAAEMADQGIALEVVREVRERLRGDSPVDRGEEGRALDGVVEALEDAQEGGARIARIVKDLALFGRPDAKRQRTRLMDILDGAIRWLPATVARSASIQVENGGAPDVVASAGQIEQVLVNLVTNAAKATPAGQRDTVIVRIGPGVPGMARVEVIDHGIGIDPAIRDHIFDPFFTTRPAGPERGTGLGLAICHSILTAHGGTLTFESEVGKGSTFRLELPAAPVEVVSTG
jgi:PAS domain S-box-containing protein